jgi:hypothetical protein
LVTAVALYQADHGQPPAKVDALLQPAYLAALPLDAFTGQPFRYRISTGETLEEFSENPLTLLPGQAVVESEDQGQVWPVPLWSAAR